MSFMLEFEVFALKVNALGLAAGIRSVSRMIRQRAAATGDKGAA